MSLQTSGKNELIQYVRSVKGGGHGCLLYDDEDSLWDLEVEYLKRGVEDGFQSALEVMKGDEERTKAALISRDVDVERYLREGSLALWLLEPDQVQQLAQNHDIDGFLGSVKTNLDNALKTGKSGLRVASNTSSYFHQHGFSDFFFSLENSLHTILETPLAVLCTFNVSDLTPSERPYALKDVLEHYRRISERNPKVMESHGFALFVSRNGGAIAELHER